MSTGTTDADLWDRSLLLRTLLIVALAGVTLLGGLGYAIYNAVTSVGRPEPHTPVAAAKAAEQMPSGQARRGAIAAAPMLAVPPEASRSGTPASNPAPAITIPAAGKVGPAKIPTGFPQTPEGAIGQLAAIETTVVQSMSIEQARTVYQAWSAPDAAPVQKWELIANIQAFLGSGAGQYADDLTTVVVTAPVAAQVKGLDGQAWVVACVLLDVKARIATQARIAYGHCARMQWSTDNGGRWVIASGTAPARAPSTWPGTDLAREAGWRPWAAASQE